MELHRKSTILGVAAGALGTILLAVGAWLVVVYTGAYDVAASDMHGDAVRWTLDTTMHRAVARRADALELPEPPPPALLAEGASHYASSCAHCHGTPGSEGASWAQGMRPEPPHLAHAATDWTAAEIHWIIDNGIKMSGMPAFGGDHDEDALLALTAFVTALPGLTADDYAALTDAGRGGAAEHGTGSAHHHGGSAPHDASLRDDAAQGT